VRIGLLSDSHGFLDEAIFTHFADCDEIWHAGDFGSLELLNRLDAFKPLRGVFGNIDDGAVRQRVSLDLGWECEGIQVYMTHIGGYPGRYERNVKKELTKRTPAVFICGHSHILRVMRDEGLGLLHMNPGACGHQGWHTERTVITFTAQAGKIGDLAVIQLGPRGRGR
jgi:putative phosphoesterase